MDNPDASLNLLLAKDRYEAEKTAETLDNYNNERRKIERDISTQAVENVRERFDPEKDVVIVEGNMEWHLGVIGIVASRVMREFYRPTFILASDGDGWKGSARSIEGFDLAERSEDHFRMRKHRFPLSAMRRLGFSAPEIGPSRSPSRIRYFAVACR